MHENIARAKTNRYGLSVDDQGKIIKDANIFYGMGLNYYDAFTRLLDDNNDTSYEDGFRRISEAGIPFIRFSINGYYPNDLNLYIEKPERFFYLADKFIETAQRFCIGLIPSLFWNYYTVPDAMDEPVRSMGDPTSKTISYTCRFIEDVISRYLNCSAIWAWEIGNEYNLEADLSIYDMYPPIVESQGTPSLRSNKDQLTSDDIISFYRINGKKIREIDHERMIISGDAVHRENMMHLRRHEKGIDTLNEFKTGVKMFTPDPIDTISTHIYELHTTRFEADNDVNIDTLLKLYTEIGRSNKKGVYFGEFAAFGADPKTEEESRGKLIDIFSAIESADVQLSSPWNFEMRGMTHGSFSDKGPGSFCFDMVAEVNESYRKKGFQ